MDEFDKWFNSLTKEEQDEYYAEQYADYWVDYEKVFIYE